MELKKNACQEVLTLRTVGLSCCLLIGSSAALSATGNEAVCGIAKVGEAFQGYGPFDYRTATREQKVLVESAHFPREVEMLIRGRTSVLGSDIDYTLRAFPNHPRALKSLMDLQGRAKTDRPVGTRWPVWCYFDRAIRFTPDDPQVRVLYGIYLLRNHDNVNAVSQLRIASELAEGNADVHYNLGLAYFAVSDFDKSLQHAHKAYELGFPLGGLRKKLQDAGKWIDLTPKSKADSDSNPVVPMRPDNSQ